MKASRWVRVVATVALIIGVLVTVAGCGSNPNGGGAASTGDKQSPTLQKILNDKVLRVGITTTIPNAWKNPKTGEWEGYNVEVAKGLAKELNVRLELVEAPLDVWIPMLQQGKIDIHMLGWFMTPQRATQVDFTMPVFKKGYAIVVRADRADLTSIEQLNSPSFTVTGLLGGSEETIAKNYLPKAKTSWLKATNPMDAAMEVKNKRADAWIYPADIMPVFLKMNTWAKQLNPEPIWVNPLAYCIRKGDPEWKFFLDAVITQLKESGTIDNFIKEANQKAYDQILASGK